MNKEQLTEFQNQFAESMEQWFEMTLAFDIGQEQSGITPEEYEDETLLYSTKVFSHVVMNKMYFTEEASAEKLNNAEAFGKELRQLIKKYTLKDTHDLANNI